VLELEGENEIGELEITPATQASQARVNIKLSEIICGSGVPRQYDLKFTEISKHMYVLKSSEDSAKIEGTVNRECFVRPVLNEEYLLYRKERTEIEKPKKTTQVIDYLKEGKRGERFGTIGELETLARRRRRALLDRKRERLEKPMVMDLLFKAFEKQPLWTVKDLADFSGQPIAYIQELIPEICVLNKKDYRNTYELKPEYK
jgi:transcription initiation factor TFIIF subunit beta